MKLYMVASRGSVEHGFTDWRPGTVRVTADKNWPFVVYEHPLIAAIMHLAHTRTIDQPVLFEIESDDEPVFSGQVKCKVQSYTIVKQVDMPTMTFEQLIEIAIRCTLPYSNTPEDAQWCEWAQAWLSGHDRSLEFADFIENMFDGQLEYSAQSLAAKAAASTRHEKYPHDLLMSAMNAIRLANHVSEHKLDLITIVEQVYRWEEAK